MSFKCLNLRNVILFFLLKFFYEELRSTSIFIHFKAFLIQSCMFFSYLFDSILMSLIFSTRVTIVLKNILFFHFKSSNTLLTQSFLILQLFILSLKEFVCLCWFSKFTIDKFIFPWERLNIFSQLRGLCCFNLNNLLLMFNLFPKVLIFLS